MGTPKQEQSTMGRLNSVVLKVLGIIYFLLGISYIPDVLSGYRSIPYYILFLSIMWIPYFLSFILYKKNHDTVAVRKELAFGFGIAYTFVILTATSTSTYTYFFPVFVLGTIYTDEKYLMRMTVAGLIVNIIDIANDFRVDSALASSNMTNYQIQVVTLIVTGIFAYMVAKMLNKINQERLADIKRQSETTEILLEKVLQSSELITKNIESLSAEALKLDENSASVGSSIEDIYNGTNEATNTVQEQLAMTHSVNQKITESFEMANTLTEGFIETEKNANVGMEKLRKLNTSAQTTNKSNEVVTKSASILSNKMNDMYSILDLINNIADQTSLLSLNASIEAARAGDAGKGFGVVAGEIQKLAQNTTEATAEIQELLNQLKMETEKTNNAVNELNEANAEQYVLIEESYANFEKILANIVNFSQNLKKQNELMEAVKIDNSSLTESVEYFSAFSEEMLANTANSKEIIADTMEGIKNQTLALQETMKGVEVLKEATK